MRRERGSRRFPSQPEQHMRVFVLAAAVSCAMALPAHAQHNITAKDVAGTWEVRGMLGPKDTVFVTYTTVVASDGKTGMVHFPGRDPIQSRLVAMAGDSTIVEVRPYPSILRPGVTVTTRGINHFSGNTFKGTFVAVYSNGDTVRGKAVGTKK